MGSSADRVSGPGGIAAWIGSALGELGSYARPSSWYRVPWRQRQFWKTQALVLLIAGVHGAIEVWEVFGPHTALSFIPISFYFVPVVYAATSFGIAGSVPTAIWCAALTAWNALAWHQGADRGGEIFQMGVIVLVGAFVGARVDQQQRARDEAERASLAHELSETKYRALFESSGEGILVLRDGEQIAEANDAVAALLGRSVEELRGRALDDVLAPRAAATLRAAARDPGAVRGDVAIATPDGTVAWLQPVSRPLAGERSMTHVLLRDVTEQRSRQERLEMYAGEILKAQEEERRRVAQELHDDTIQSLIALVRLLDSEGVDDREPLRAYAESIVDRVRGFIHGLRPPALDDLGLSEALRRTLLDVRERSAIEVEIDVEGEERRLPPEVELVLFRVGQEALHNVERHSGADAVEVALRYEEGGTRLTVRDNGRGFDVPANPDRLPAQRKLGLMGMRERARTVAATIDIRSAPGEGTTVEIHVPTRDERRREPRFGADA